MSLANFDTSSIDEAEFAALARKFPAPARDIVDRLIAARIESSSKYAADSAVLQKLVARVRDIEARIANAEREKTKVAVWRAEDETAIEALREDLARAKATRDRKRTEMDKIVSVPPERRTWQRIYNSLTPSFNDFAMESGSRARFESFKPDTKGYKLEKVRAQIDSAIDALLALDQTPRDVEEIVADMRSALDALEAAGAPDVSGLFRNTGFRDIQQDIMWPTQMVQSGPLDFNTAFAVWQNREGIERGLEQLIRERMGERKGIRAAERAATQDKLKAKVLELQRIEAALCFEAEEAAEDVSWRRLHPLAVLQLVRVQDEPIPDFGAGTAVMPGTGKEIPTAGVPLDQARSEFNPRLSTGLHRSGGQ